MPIPTTFKAVQVDSRKLWMSQKEAMAYLGVSKDFLKNRCLNGTLHWSMVGNVRFFIKSEIDNMVISGAITGKQLFKAQK